MDQEDSVVAPETHPANEDELPSKMMGMHIKKLELNPQDHIFFGKSR